MLCTRIIIITPNSSSLIKRPATINRGFRYVGARIELQKAYMAKPPWYYQPLEVIERTTVTRCVERSSYDVVK